MPEQNEQDILLQNQSNENEWSDLIKQDGGLLNWNTTSEEWNGGKKKRRFDLLWSRYEDSIWNSNLDGDKNDKNLPKTYPWKKWRNARAIVLLVDVVLNIIWLLMLPLEILSTILMIVFLILRIKAIRKPENQEIIKKKNMWKRLKSVIWIYVILTLLYAFFDTANVIFLLSSDKWANDFDNRVKTEYLNLYDNDEFWHDVTNEFDNIWNTTFWCNCYWDYATESIWYIDQLTSNKKIKHMYTMLKATIRKNLENGEWSY